MDAVQSVYRSLMLLNCLGDESGPLGLSELSRAVVLPKSTTKRLLATLLQSEYVKYDEQTEKYELGSQILRLGSRMLNSLELRNEARDVALKLRELTGQTVFVAVLDKFEVIYIDKFAGEISMRASVGSRASAHCTAIGKACLAYLPEKTLDELLARNELYRLTPNTITDPMMLREELCRIRSQGYAMDEKENREEIRCVAAPVMNYNGQVAGSISISGFEGNFTPEKVKEALVHLLQATSEISRRMGYFADKIK